MNFRKTSDAQRINFARESFSTNITYTGPSISNYTSALRPVAFPNSDQVQRRTFSSSDTDSYPPTNLQSDGPSYSIARTHFDELHRYLNSGLVKKPSASGSRTAARKTLARLTRQQLRELSTDVYDDLVRRRTNLNDTDRKVPYLPIRDDFPPERNQARQKLATLRTGRFSDLSGDVYHELARRYPELKELAHSPPPVMHEIPSQSDLLPSLEEEKPGDGSATTTTSPDDPPRNASSNIPTYDAPTLSLVAGEEDLLAWANVHTDDAPTLPFVTEEEDLLAWARVADGFVNRASSGGPGIDAVGSPAVSRVPTPLAPSVLPTPRSSPRGTPSILELPAIVHDNDAASVTQDVTADIAVRKELEEQLKEKDDQLKAKGEQIVQLQEKVRTIETLEKTMADMTVQHRKEVTHLHEQITNLVKEVTDVKKNQSKELVDVKTELDNKTRELSSVVAHSVQYREGVLAMREMSERLLASVPSPSSHQLASSPPCG
ncbi:component of the polarisome [Steccherinum ochraceum]|uniref:Component of the polarisome n=1 Tax=Steccherinum ochraceum TaxID=92696 RepID=A0A4V6N7A3_9APHY|nr:component of the polarisome [Steccherinum ochraceum]